MTFNISEKNLVPNGNNEVFIQFVNNYVSKNCCHTESIVWEKNKDIWQVAFPLNNYFRLKKSLQRYVADLRAWCIRVDVKSSLATL